MFNYPFSEVSNVKVTLIYPDKKSKDMSRNIKQEKNVIRIPLQVQTMPVGQYMLKIEGESNIKFEYVNSFRITDKVKFSQIQYKLNDEKIFPQTFDELLKYPNKLP